MRVVLLVCAAMVLAGCATEPETPTPAPTPSPTPSPTPTPDVTPTPSPTPEPTPEPTPATPTPAPTPPTPTPTPTPTPNGTQNATVETAKVDILLFSYTPSNLNAKPNTNVTWTNGDAVPHTVTSDEPLFDSGNLGSAGKFSFVFTTPGTYGYHCKIHPTMKGTITVA